MKPPDGKRKGPSEKRDPRQARRSVARSAVLLCLVASTFGAPARGDLNVGDRIPGFSLPDLQGKARSWEEFKGRSVVICFGELYNKNTLDALRDLAALVERPPLKDAQARYLLILGTRDPAARIQTDWEKLREKDDFVLVLHDRQRAVFEGFDVKVLPTFAVANPDGRLVLFMSGYPLNFADVVTDAILHAEGKIGRERLDRTLRPTATSSLDENRLKAIRTSRMASALAKRKLYDIAVRRFEEALALDPTLVPARLGFAEVRLDQARIQESEALYKEVLEIAPGNLAAHIGLARIEIKRDQLAQAEERLKQQVALHVLQPELHFLLGAVYERRDQKDKALSAYKRAAQLLLERSRQQ